ncbi:MAG: hypothetical protein NTW21_25985 [Verrucomicrobia bacterium]|nr:hypothetical protein [Verrucomicrobiota bacterium]
MNEPSQFLLHTAPDGAVKVDVFFKDETVWLTQKALAELFGVQRLAITKHLGNIFESGELAEDSVCSILEHTASDGRPRMKKHSFGPTKDPTRSVELRFVGVLTKKITPP